MPGLLELLELCISGAEILLLLHDHLRNLGLPHEVPVYVAAVKEFRIHFQSGVEKHSSGKVPMTAVVDDFREAYLAAVKALSFAPDANFLAKVEASEMAACASYVRHVYVAPVEGQAAGRHLFRAEVRQLVRELCESRGFAATLACSYDTSLHERLWRYICNYSDCEALDALKSFTRHLEGFYEEGGDVSLDLFGTPSLKIALWCIRGGDPPAGILGRQFKAIRDATSRSEPNGLREILQHWGPPQCKEILKGTNVTFSNYHVGSDGRIWVLYNLGSGDKWTSLTGYDGVCKFEALD